MEPISEQNIEQSHQNYDNPDGCRENSSDFSDFELAPKQRINGDFSPYQKPQPKKALSKKPPASKKNKN